MAKKSKSSIPAWAPWAALGAFLDLTSSRPAEPNKPKWVVELERARGRSGPTIPSWAVDLLARAESVSGVPRELLAAVIRTESNWQPTVISSAGAIGLMQLMPATAESLGVTDSMDPEQNVMGGARYLREQLDRFNSVPLALAAYNAGPHRVEQYRGIPPYRETQTYVERVLQRFSGALR